MSCRCKCHVMGPQSSCDVEYAPGSSGIPGVKSCSPCDYRAGNDESVPSNLCERVRIVLHWQPATNPSPVHLIEEGKQ